MKNIKEDISKPTLSKPVGALGKGYQSNFNRTMQQSHVNLNETDGLLTEREQSLKKKIFSLAKMEALVFADPKLSTVYDEMSENGEEKYGYHYNETIMNMLFNDYVLNSPKYLQKYKMAIPKKKKRRDKSGINQLKKAGDITMHKKPVNPIQTTPATTKIGEETGAASSGAYAPALGYKSQVEETTSSASSGAFSGPAAWGGGDLMKGGKSKAMRKPIWQGGTIIQESNYLTDPSAFAKYIKMLSEEVEINPSAEKNAASIQQPNVKPYTNAAVNNKIIDKTAAFSSNTVKQWDKPDTELELHTLNKGTMDEPAQGLEEIEVNVPAGAKRYSPDMYSTKEDLKELIERTKQRTGKGLQKDQIPMLAGEALYTIAVKMADHLAPIGWNEMGDTNSMWDYIDDQGNMSFDRLLAAVKEAVSDRMGSDDMGMMDETVAGYNIPNPEFFKQIGWLPIKSYKYGGVSVFEPTEYEKSKGAQYVIGAPYEEQFEIRPYPLHGKEDNYLIQDNPRFWYKSIRVDDTNNKIYYIGDDGKPKFLTNNQGIEINPSKNWTHNVDNERFMYKLEKMKKDGATFKLTDEMDGATAKLQNDAMIETAQSIIDDKPDSVAKGTPTGTVSRGNVPVGLVDMKEEMDLLNEIDNELNAYSIHQKKLQHMSEDRKPSSLVLKDRLGAENQTNFKKDFANSDTKDVINIEKELQWKDQQTDVPTDPMKLGQDIENAEIKSTDAKGKEYLKNVGNSTNDKGDEIPKRNMTTAEQDEVNLYRKGMHSLVYDNKPDQHFEDRMKADMGDAVYEIRQKQMADFGKAPMYNKEAQPTQATKAPRTEFDKEKSGWNDLQGLKEAMISGRYRNALDKSHIIDFAINEVMLVKKINENLFPLDFTGLGNSFNAKTVDYKVSVNEGVIGVLDAHKFYTDGKQVFAIKNPKQNLSETFIQGKPVVNEEMNKMKHLLGYKPNTFVSTDKTKKNRGF